MKLLLKILGWTIVGIVGLLAAAVVALQLISDDTYRKWVVEGVTSATGRTLAIDGPFTVDIGTTIGVEAGGVRFQNAPWGSRDHMVEVENAKVAVDVLPLFQGVLDVLVEIDGPDILLETNDEGLGNWVIGEPGDPAEAAPPSEDVEDATGGLPIKPYIRNFEISQMRFAFKDATADRDLDVGVETLRLHVADGSLPLSLAATFNGTPIELIGSLGEVEDWYANRSTPVALSGTFNEASLVLTGDVGPTYPEPAANLEVKLTVDNTATFTPFIEPFAGVAVPALDGFDVALALSGESGRWSVPKIALTLHGPRLSLSVGGSLEDLTGVGEVEINAEASSSELAALFEELNLDQPYQLPDSIELRAGLSGDLGKLSVTGLELAVDDEGIDLDIDGSLDDLIALTGADATVTLRIDSTAVIGDLIATPIPDFGPVDVSATLTSAEEAIRVETVNLALDGPELTATVDGSVARIARGEDGGIEVSGIEIGAGVNTDKLTELLAKLAVTVPGELPASVNLDAQVDGSLDRLALTSLEGNVTDPDLTVRLTGQAAHILGPEGLEARIEATVPSVAKLSRFAGVALPDLGALNLDGRVVSENDTAVLEGLNITLEGEALMATVDAAIADLMALLALPSDQSALGSAGISVTLSTEVPALDPLIERLNALDGVAISLPNSLSETLGSVTLDAKAGSAGDTLALESMNLDAGSDLMKIGATATVADLLAPAGIDASAALSVDSLRPLSQLAGAPLPETGPVSLKATAAAPDGIDGPTEFSADITGDIVKVNANASVADLKAPADNLDATLTLDAPSLAAIGGVLGRDWASEQPLSVRSSVKARPGDIALEGLEIDLGQGQVRSDLRYTHPVGEAEGRHKVVGKVVITDLNLTPIVEPDQSLEAQAEAEAALEEVLEEADDEEQEEAEAVAEPEPGTGKKLFSSEPLSTAWLQNYDIDLKVETTNLALGEGFIVEGGVALTLDRGLLNLGPVNFLGKTGGRGEALVTLDARSEAAHLDVFVNVEEMVPPRFGGKLNIDVDLDGGGESIAALMADLNGRFIVSLEDVPLKASAMTQLGAGLIRNINPLASDTTVLECAIARFDIENGIVDFDKKIAAQTTEVTWFGNGEINLQTEALDLGVHPKPRSTVSSLTNLDLAQLIHIGGTLAEPKIGIDPKDVAKKYAKYSAYIATGGLSWLAEKLVDARRANVDQCERILADLEDN